MGMCMDHTATTTDRFRNSDDNRVIIVAELLIEQTLNCVVRLLDSLSSSLLRNLRLT